MMDKEKTAPQEQGAEAQKRIEKLRKVSLTISLMSLVISIACIILKLVQ